MAIAPNFAPGGVENGWKYTIPSLLDSPDLLVVDIRPDGILGAQSYPAVFDKDFTCRKSLFSNFFPIFISPYEGDDEGDGITESVINPGVLVAVGIIIVFLIIIMSISMSIFIIIYCKKRKKKETPSTNRRLWLQMLCDPLASCLFLQRYCQKTMDAK